MMQADNFEKPPPSDGDRENAVVVVSERCIIFCCPLSGVVNISGIPGQK